MVTKTRRGDNPATGSVNRTSPFGPRIASTVFILLKPWPNWRNQQGLFLRMLLRGGAGIDALEGVGGLAADVGIGISEGLLQRRHGGPGQPAKPAQRMRGVSPDIRLAALETLDQGGHGQFRFAMPIAQRKRGLVGR